MPRLLYFSIVFITLPVNVYINKQNFKANAGLQFGFFYMFSFMNFKTTFLILDNFLIKFMKFGTKVSFWRTKMHFSSNIFQLESYRFRFLPGVL